MNSIQLIRHLYEGVRATKTEATVYDVLSEVEGLVERMLAAAARVDSTAAPVAKA